MERLGDELERELRKFGAAGTISVVVAAWPQAVGEEVARNAWPARISKEGVLHVSTSSSAWAFELTQLAGVVLERLVQELADAAPKGLRFAPGHLPEPDAPAAREARPTTQPPSPEEVAEGRELASAIGSDDLRREVARAAALSLQRARADRRV